MEKCKDGAMAEAGAGGGTRMTPKEENATETRAKAPDQGSHSIPNLEKTERVRVR